MSAQYDAYGNPATVGDPGRGDEQYDADGIAATIGSVRTLGMYEALRQRLVVRVSAPSPAAGADFTFVPTFMSPVELLSVYWTFVTSAVVANRFPSVIHQDAAANVLGRFGANQAIAASLTARVFFGAGMGAASAAASSFPFTPLPSPPITLMPGDKFVSSTAALDAGDQISGIVVTVRDWSVGAVYWAADLLGRELGFESLTDLPASTPLPEGAGQPIPVSPIAR